MPAELFASARDAMPKTKATPRRLNERQRRFVELFMGRARGNASEAARQAGYAEAYAGRHAGKLLKNAAIKDAIAARVATDPAVADRKERQAFWTVVMRGGEGYEDAPLAERIRASEILGKSQADFTERYEHTVTEIPPYAPSKRNLDA